MNQRIKHLRKELKLNQEIFSSKINISRSHFAMIESGTKNITDRVIADICRVFNVNEDWLRTGSGEMFIEQATFSLDEFARSKGATDLELEIVKMYFDMPEQLREGIQGYFKDKVLPRLRSTQENIPKDIYSEFADDSNFQSYKEKELAAYSLELDAEAKVKMSSLSEKQEVVS